MTDVIYVDASFKDGVAGIAVVGSLGCHSRLVNVTTSHRAERLALELALELARETDRRDLVFRTDCLDLARAASDGRLGHLLPDGRGWTVEYVHRSKVAGAHNLANSIRRAATRPAAPRSKPAKRSREWLEAHPVPRWSSSDREGAP